MLKTTHFSSYAGLFASYGHLSSINLFFQAQAPVDGKAQRKFSIMCISGQLIYVGSIRC